MDKNSVVEFKCLGEYKDLEEIIKLSQGKLVLPSLTEVTALFLNHFFSVYGPVNIKEDRGIPFIGFSYSGQNASNILTDIKILFDNYLSKVFYIYTATRVTDFQKHYFVTNDILGDAFPNRYRLIGSIPDYDGRTEWPDFKSCWSDILTIPFISYTSNWSLLKDYNLALKYGKQDLINDFFDQMYIEANIICYDLRWG